MTAAVISFPDARVDDDGPLPEGEYSLAYTGHQLAFVFGTGKLYIRFRVVEGEYVGSRLYRAYRVTPTGKHSFTVPKSSALYRQWCRLSGRAERRDRINPKLLRNTVVRAMVRTVTRDSRQRSLEPYLQYSVVDEILEIVVGTLRETGHA